MDLTLKDCIAEAEKAGACKEAIGALKKYNSLDDALLDDKAPFWSYWYARNVINGRWELGEAAIAKDTEWSYKYACNVIKGRWELGEVAIAKDAEWSYWYARDVIKGRWELRATQWEV